MNVYFSDSINKTREVIDIQEVTHYHYLPSKLPLLLDM